MRNQTLPVDVFRLCWGHWCCCNRRWFRKRDARPFLLASQGKSGRPVMEVEVNLTGTKGSKSELLWMNLYGDLSRLTAHACQQRLSRSLDVKCLVLG